MSMIIIVGCSDDEDDPEPELKYNLSLDVNPEGAGNVTGAGEYHEGEEVSIHATALDEWEFVYWTGDTLYVDDTHSATATITMPSQNISLIAEFDKFMCGDNITFNYNDEEVTFGTILRGGLCWMDRNLGADPMPFVPAEDATGNTDTRLYGDLFQWGRLVDGHQARHTDTITGPVDMDIPGHGKFITVNTNPYDWRSPQNNNLWQGEDGINNPCPEGWRLPVITELDAELQSWSIQNSDGAFESALKWPLAGWRAYNGAPVATHTQAQTWSSSYFGTHAYILLIVGPHGANTNFSVHRANGSSVRCVRNIE